MKVSSDVNPFLGLERTSASIDFVIATRVGADDEDPSVGKAI